MSSVTSSAIPVLPVDSWAATRETLHMWLQIVGKLRMACTPPINHWWHVTLTVTARGLGTGAVPYEGRLWDAEFDFISHELVLRTDDGERTLIALRPMSVADFYREVQAALSQLGLDIRIHASPNEVADAIPFGDDTVHASYEADHAQLFWRQLAYAHRILSVFRAEYTGKVSPVHFFWGAMDIAVTRFSGREAPPHPGGAPNCPDWVMREGYSHELSSAGFWPGGGDEGAFYSYVYPATDRFALAEIPGPGYFDTGLGEFVLPFEHVRDAADPDAVVLQFLRATYDVAVRDGRWDA